jgi:hypothetical protein
MLRSCFLVVMSVHRFKDCFNEQFGPVRASFKLTTGYSDTLFLEASIKRSARSWQ